MDGMIYWTINFVSNCNKMDMRSTINIIRVYLLANCCLIYATTAGLPLDPSVLVSSLSVSLEGIHSFGYIPHHWFSLSSSCQY